MADLAPPTLSVLPFSTYISDKDRTQTESLTWYGPGKLHPLHPHDTLSSTRYIITHKLDHTETSTSWLARDTHTATWRRIDAVLASRDVTYSHASGAARQLAQRAEQPSPSAADAQGLLLETFYEDGPNGTHLCLVFPLNGGGNCFRWTVGDDSRLSEGWFVRQCAGLRGEGPGSVHDITEGEMGLILGGGPQKAVKVDEALRRAVGLKEGEREEGLPRYLVLRPEGLGVETEFWLSEEAFERKN